MTAERAVMCEALRRGRGSAERPSTVRLDHCVNLAHQRGCFGERSGDALVVREVVVGKQAAFAVLAAAPDLLDTSLCSISVREKGQSWQSRSPRQRVTSPPWDHSLRGSAGALPASVRWR